MIDIHTHNLKDNLNIYNQSIFDTKSLKNEYFSLGIHPWDLEKYEIDYLKNSLIKSFDKFNTFFFGECGLDYFKKIDRDLQLDILTWQLETFRDKNFIFHCVKAYSDLYACLKKNPVKNIILHDYNGNADQSFEFLKLPNTFFSLGANFLKDSKKLKGSLKIIGLDRIFFETDDHNFLIKEVYEKYCSDYGVSMTTLKSQIRQNFKKLILF